MRKIDVENSAAERLELHADRRGVDLGVMIHFALNALEGVPQADGAAQAAPRSSSKGSTPESHGSVSVMYGDAPIVSVAAPAAQGGSVDAVVVDPDNLPDLTHTRFQGAEVDGHHVPGPYWSELLDFLIARAIAQSVEISEIRRLSTINIVDGHRSGTGFRHLEGPDVSIQNQDSNAVCRVIVALARHLGVALEANFTWMEKEGVLHRGRSGRLTV